MLGISFLASADSPITVEVAATSGMINEFKRLLESVNNEVIALPTKVLKDKDLPVITLVILKQALHHGGLLVKFDFMRSPNHARSQALVQSGDVLVAMVDIEDDSTPKDTLKSSSLGSSPIIYRGIFGLESNHALMKVKTLKELKKFTAVTNSSWDDTIALLQEISPAELYLAPNRDSLFKMIAYRNFDFTALNFKEKPEKGYYLHNKHNAPKGNKKLDNPLLVPVPGVSLQILQSSSLHFILAKKRPESQKVYQALEKGLAIMRQQGLLQQYVNNSHLARPNLIHLKVLNSQ